MGHLILSRSVAKLLADQVENYVSKMQPPSLPSLGVSPFDEIIEKFQKILKLDSLAVIFIYGASDPISLRCKVISRQRWKLHLENATSKPTKPSNQVICTFPSLMISLTPKRGRTLTRWPTAKPSNAHGPFDQVPASEKSIHFPL
jgi:hypothetical protein